ncbi:hypothetical protein K439DRAFT_457586 [Ramaria rubella]|nr:hypothetical protein K439DRAFT_457586 [Ramaria rubella]
MLSYHPRATPLICTARHSKLTRTRLIFAVAPSRHTGGRHAFSSTLSHPRHLSQPPGLAPHHHSACLHRYRIRKLSPLSLPPEWPTHLLHVVTSNSFASTLEQNVCLSGYTNAGYTFFYHAFRLTHFHISLCCTDAAVLISQSYPGALRTFSSAALTEGRDREVSLLLGGGGCWALREMTNTQK